MYSSMHITPTIIIPIALCKSLAQVIVFRDLSHLQIQPGGKLLFSELSTTPLASPFGRGAQCAHWAERVSYHCFDTLSVKNQRFLPALPEGEPRAPAALRPLNDNLQFRARKNRPFGEGRFHIGIYASNALSGVTIIKFFCATAISSSIRVR